MRSCCRGLHRDICGRHGRCRDDLLEHGRSRHADVEHIGNLSISAISQINSTTTGGTTASPSSAGSGYSFILNGSTTTASGSFNLTFSAKSGVLETGSSSAFVVTLTPAVGYSGTVTAIGFGSRSTSTGPTTLSLRSSSDSYASNVAVFATSTNSTWAYFTSTFSPPVVIESGSSLTLRLYGSGGSSANSGNWRLDDLQLTAVVVPEPAALVLGAVGAAGIVARVLRRGRLGKETADPSRAELSATMPPADTISSPPETITRDVFSPR